MIISAGMPRAGSGWYYNLVHDLVVASGGQNARSIRNKYHLQRFLTEVNCNISTLKSIRLIPVLIPALLGNRYVIKTHAGPTSFSEWLLRDSWIDTLYIYRDPRATLLSAYEYGQQAVKRNRHNAFSHLKTLDEAAKFMEFYVGIWKAWSKVEHVFMVRYEDLMANYMGESQRLVDHLHLKLDQDQTEQIFARYRPEKGDPQQVGTHYQKGEAERFRHKFTPSELERFTILFESALRRMGYVI
jgi:hypothetical protein